MGHPGLVPGWCLFHSLPMRSFEPTVYILASRYRGALYTGVTSDLLARIHQHRCGTFGGYAKRRGIELLAWFERHEDIQIAIRREKTIKRWSRQWKFNTIEASNPEWRDLAVDLGFSPL